MSSASSESEVDVDPLYTKQKIRKSKKRRDASQKDSDFEEESLADHLSCLLSAEEENESDCDRSDDSIDENECIQDINSIADVLENRKLENKTFNDLQLRDIERKNGILMNKILTHNRRPSQYQLGPMYNKMSSSQINRKKQQQQIDRDNLMLLKKIKSVKPFGLSCPKK